MKLIGVPQEFPDSSEEDSDDPISPKSKFSKGELSSKIQDLNSQITAMETRFENEEKKNLKKGSNQDTILGLSTQ